MNARITLYTLLLATCLTSGAKDRMKITFNDASTVSYDVETITDITFNESDAPVTPPAPSNKVLVTRINDMVYTYDAQGRCTSISVDDDAPMIYDYETMKLKIYGYTIGTFTLTSEGYFSSITLDFMGVKASRTMEYNSEGYITHTFASYSDEEYSSENDAEFYWENNLLVKIVSKAFEKDFDGDVDNSTEFCIINYSQQENKTNQWTLAMGDSDANEEFVTGMYGNAPSRLPSSCKWDSDQQKNASYTLNSDGSIKTEKFGNETYNYYYASNPSAAPLKSNIRNIMRRISDKIAVR